MDERTGKSECEDGGDELHMPISFIRCSAASLSTLTAPKTPLANNALLVSENPIFLNTVGLQAHLAQPLNKLKPTHA
jgi:hypothetical protein